MKVRARFKRFRVRSSSEVFVHVEFSSGNKHILRIVDASLTGLSALSSLTKDEIQEEVSLDSLIPSSKIVYGNDEVQLGRTLVRRIESDDNGTRIAISTVDIQIPLHGKLGALFEEIRTSKSAVDELEVGESQLLPNDFVLEEDESSNLFERCFKYDKFVEERKKKNSLFQWFSVRHSSVNSDWEIRFAGDKRISKVKSFNSYDYLGYSNHQAVQDASIHAIRELGCGSPGSLLMCGKTKYHEELEEMLATLTRQESCLLFTSGYSANAGTLRALLRPTDLAVTDVLSHASIADSLRSCYAKTRYFLHNSSDSAEKVLSKYSHEATASLLITEGLFSMDGDLPNLKDMVTIAKSHETRVFIDEAHSFGTIGPTGLGLIERHGDVDVDLVMGTLSKAIGCSGAFVCGPRSVITWLRYFAGSNMYSIALSAHSAAGALAALKLHTSDQSSLVKLRSNISYFHHLLRERIDYIATSDIESPIVPILTVDSSALASANAYLRSRGFFVNPITAPAVPRNKPRFRFSITAVHSHRELEDVVDCLRQAEQMAGTKVFQRVS